ncbi:MAG: VOC family protein [Candidatus Hermodarchaeota archaeon]
METNLELDFRNLKIHHICYIFQEPEKHAHMMESLFKMPKFEFSEDLDHPAIYRGRDTKFSIKIGVGRCLSISIEVFQWLKGDCIYKEFVDSQKEGIHHFGVFVEDLQKYIDKFQEEGIDVVQSGIFPPRLKYAYMDTVNVFGTVIELMEMMKRKKIK